MAVGEGATGGTLPATTANRGCPRVAAWPRVQSGADRPLPAGYAPADVHDMRVRRRGPAAIHDGCGIGNNLLDFVTVRHIAAHRPGADRSLWRVALGRRSGLRCLHHRCRTADSVRLAEQAA